MAGFAPTFEGGMGIEGAVQTPLSPAAGSDLSAANSLLGLFASSGGSSSGRAPSADERNADLWRRTMGDVDIASASMDQLNQFQKQHPSAGPWAFDAAETMLNESVQAKRQEISVEQQLDEAFLTSPVGIVASQNASSMEDSAAGQSYLANARAQFVSNNFRTEELTRETQQYGVNEDRRTEMWTLSAFDLKAGADVINTAYVDAVEALVLDPTQTINFDEIEGLVTAIPQLAGTVMTRENAPQVLQKVRDAYQENQTRQIAAARGLQPGELGVMPDAVANSVFAGLDATVVWSEKELDPGEIRKRLENTTFNQMVGAGVPLDVISSISMATAGNPALQAAAMSALTEGTGAVLELYNSAEFAEARQANKNLAANERVRAFAGFSEMARVWGGTSSVASVYEEVNVTERALKFGAATIAALDTVMVEAESQGTPASLGQNFYRQNLEQLAPQFDAAIAANPAFGPEIVTHLTSDLNVQLQDINQTANDAGYKVSVGDNDKLIFIPTEEGLLGIQKIEAEIAALESGERGNPRDFRGVIEGYKKEIQKLQTPPTMSLNDLQYKWTVLNGLGEVGSEVRTIASAEFGLELASDVGSDAREALTGGSVAEMSNQAPTELIATAESMLGMNESSQRETLASFLQAGGTNIDPSKTAWCAAFVNATLAKTGLDGTGRLNARSFLDWGSEVTEPQLGDIVVLSRGDPNGWEGHVGFFKGFDANGDILILGGNQGDSVSVSAYSADKLLGYRRPEGISGGGTEAGLSQAIYKSANDPTFLPESAPMGSDSITTTPLSPAATPPVSTETSTTEQATTTTEERPLFQGSAISTVADAPKMDQNVLSFLESLNSSPDTTYTMSSVDDVSAAQAAGALKAGDRVLITGDGAPYLVEVE